MDLSTTTPLVTRADRGLGRVPAPQRLVRRATVGATARPERLVGDVTALYPQLP